MGESKKVYAPLFQHLFPLFSLPNSFQSGKQVSISSLFLVLITITIKWCLYIKNSPNFAIRNQLSLKTGKK